ncbi:MAG: peptidase [Planctomycetaceae bacterium]|nr:peptidase [Planctomycetaceae bacterium]
MRSHEKSRKWARPFGELSKWVRPDIAAIVCFVAVILAGGHPAGAEEDDAFQLGVDSILAKDVQQHIHTLASDTFEGRNAGSRGGHAAGIYIAQQLRKSNLTSSVSATTYFQEFGNECRNILGLLPGSDPKLKNEFILIGAHYDHVGYGTAETSNGPVGFIHNGADDNASGVSTVLEIAQAWQVSGEHPRRSIIFALWDSEEHGLLGSKHWLAHPTCQLSALRCIVNMDMVGRLKDSGMEVTGIRTLPGLRRLMSEQNRQTNIKLNFSWTVEDNSDHWPFYERKIPFIMPFTGFHDDYHKPSDDVDKVNYAGIQNIARWMYGNSRALANALELPRFRDAAFQETPAVQQQREAPLPAAEPRLALTLAPADAGPGRVIARVYPQTAPAVVGLQSGDRIIKFGDTEIAPQTNLAGLILRAPSPVRIHAIRPGQEKPIRVQLPLVGKPVRIGINWREDPAEPGVVAINLLEVGSPAEVAGLKFNDRILQVNGENFKSGEECRKLLLESPSPLPILIERYGQLRTLTIDVPELTAKAE